MLHTINLCEYYQVTGEILLIKHIGIDPIDGVTRLVGDFTSQKTQQNIYHILNGKTIDFIMR